MAARQKHEEDVKALAMERVLNYGDRKKARLRLPDGFRASFDVSLRMRGTVTKGTRNEQAPVQTLVCRMVVADVCRQLGVKPAELGKALRAAVKRRMADVKDADKPRRKKRVFLGDDEAPLSDPLIAEIVAVENELVPTLTPTEREGSVVVDGKVEWGECIVR